ncbi:MAG: hypothetical protein A2252_03860 [Elusimicrobia bacterium RIFOXYA2_FULL_39_19]|nr:MAG: hypothetical protein A2252_03860 [Elusimicrobia bacterium RIFOXYA2_FULL_39_19]
MLKTPLFDEHISLKALMAEFAGFQMPIQYSGIIDEHNHTRTAVSVFDICHMGEFIISGDSAAADIEKLVTCDVATLIIGRCRYGFLLNDAGYVLDDLIVYRLEEKKFMLVVNAGTISKDEAWIKARLGKNTVFENVSDKTAKLDVQGPKVLEVLNAFTGHSLEKISYYHFIQAEINGIKFIVSRTGYTGELGFELYFDASHAVEIWRKLLAYPQVKPAGLGARDTLRLEMGYPLYGHEMDETKTPAEAGFNRNISLKKDFIGKAVLEKQLSEGTALKLAGFVVDGRQSARNGFEIYFNNELTGVVTSGAFSPSLKVGIGLGYVKAEHAIIGNKIEIVSGSRKLSAGIVKPPFYKNASLKSK